MDALELLKEDHHKVKQLFRQAEQAGDGSNRKQLFDRIESELEIHAHIEETVFYPAVEQHAELRDMVAEGRQEHEQVKELLHEMEDISPDDEEFASDLRELIESVEHHATEEESEMFPKVRDVMDERTLDDLGRRLELAKGKQESSATV